MASSREGNRSRSGKTFVAGATSGIITSTILQPLDVIRTHMQALSGAEGSSRSIRSVVESVTRKQGILGLWSGTGPTCIRIGLGAGIYFMLLDQLVTRFKALPGESGREELSAGLTLAAGALSRASAAAVLCPITVVKTRMEYSSQSGTQFKNTFHALYMISRSEGVKGLFRGLWPTLLRDAPYSGLYLLMYSRLRTQLKDKYLPEGSSQMLSNTFAGAIAGAGSTVLTHPPDVVRTHLQLDSSGKLSASEAVSSIMKKDGLKGFMNGVTPRVVKRGLQQSLTWAIFEELVSTLQGRSIWGKPI